MYEGNPISVENSRQLQELHHTAWAVLYGNELYMEDNCRRSGYSYILFETHLVTSGCIKSVLSGKAYAKTILSLRTVCEAIERLLIEQFMKVEDVEMRNHVALLKVVKFCHSENLVLEDGSFQDFIKKYREFEDKVHSSYSKMLHCNLVISTVIQRSYFIYRVTINFV